MESVLTFEGFRACVTVLMFPIYIGVSEAGYVVMCELRSCFEFLQKVFPCLA